MNITNIQNNDFFFIDPELEEDQSTAPPPPSPKTPCLSVFEKLELTHQKNTLPNTSHVPHRYELPLSYSQSSKKEIVSKVIDEAFRKLQENRLETISEMEESPQSPFQQLSSMTPNKGLIRKSPTNSNLMQFVEESR